MCVVAVGLAVAAALFVLQLQRALLSGVDDAAVDRARAVATQLAADGTPGADVVATVGDLALVQILDSSGRVAAASPNIEGEPAITDMRPAAGQLGRGDNLTPLGDGVFRVVSLGVRTRGAEYSVVVAQSLAAVHDSVRTAIGLLAVGVPVLVVVVGGATFLFVGRGLRPVEAIRAGVASIGAGDLDTRVPVPAAQDEIARLAGTMNAMLDRLASAQRTQRRFIADASHELRSPITTLRAGVEVAGLDRNPATLKALFATVTAESDRLDRLVRDLLLLARVDEHGLRLSVAEVDLDDLVEAEIGRLRACTDLRIESRLVPVRIMGDAHRLSQALRNVVDNAARHATSTVGLRLRREGDWAVVEVVDDGPGVPPADRGRVFGRFVRIDDSRARHAGGSGLGLAIVQEIVGAHGGTVRFVDAAGAGATVRIDLPVRSSRTHPGGAPSRS